MADTTGSIVECFRSIGVALTKDPELMGRQNGRIKVEHLWSYRVTEQVLDEFKRALVPTDYQWVLKDVSMGEGYYEVTFYVGRPES
jgi:hypothetical protein